MDCSVSVLHAFLAGALYSRGSERVCRRWDTWARWANGVAVDPHYAGFAALIQERGCAALLDDAFYEDRPGHFFEGYVDLANDGWLCSDATAGIAPCLLSLAEVPSTESRSAARFYTSFAPCGGATTTAEEVTPQVQQLRDPLLPADLRLPQRDRGARPRRDGLQSAGLPWHVPGPGEHPVRQSMMMT